MDANVQSPPPENNTKMKETFRKPSNDVANRKYRRHSPASGSSSDGSPKRDRSSSPVLLREDPVKVTRRRKDDEKELDRDLGRSRYDKNGGDSHRHSVRHSSRNSHGYSRHDDYSRHDKHADDEGRHYQASDWVSKDSDRGRKRDYVRNVDKYSRDRYDVPGHRNRDKEKDTNSTSEEKERDRNWRDREGRDERRDYHRSSGDYKSDRSYYSEETRGYRNDSSGRDGRHRPRESYKHDAKELDGPREKKKHDNWETSMEKDRYSKALEEQNDDKSENQASPAKKPKLFSSKKDTDYSADGIEKQSSSSKLAQDADVSVNTGQANPNDLEAATDLNAAKVAAMKAAELVNKNLVGVGFMSADQKKKLLWGNKKSTTSEESGHHWDTSLFGDRERQEKFNKLMGVKGEIKVEHKPDNQDGTGRLQAEKQKELQIDLEKQYTAGLRRRDGRTVGLGL